MVVTVLVEAPSRAVVTVVVIIGTYYLEEMVFFPEGCVGKDNLSRWEIALCRSIRALLCKNDSTPTLYGILAYFRGCL